MTVPIWLLVVCMVVTFALTVGGLKLLDRLRKIDAETQAREIIHKADQEAAAKTKEAELAIKERDLAQKAEAERQFNVIREELRERERTLDKRQETLEQQADDIRKQERALLVEFLHLLNELERRRTVLALGFSSLRPRSAVPSGSATPDSVRLSAARVGAVNPGTGCNSTISIPAANKGRRPSRISRCDASRMTCMPPNWTTAAST